MNGKLSIAAGRIAFQLRLMLYGHILNPLWWDRTRRRRRRDKAKYRSITAYLQRYTGQISRLQLATAPEQVDEPERAFTIWFQGEEKAPELVKACFRSMRRNLRQELVVLDEKTLFDWITLPDHVIEKWKSGKITHTQFSDICRVELLYEHGGIWVDATDYVTAPVPQWIMDEDFFLYMAGDRIGGWYAVFQSCFIRGRKGNPLLDAWRKADFLYWKEENSRINYFVHHFLFNLAVKANETAAKHFSRMPRVVQDPTHALWNDHYLDVYDEQAFRELTSGAFFQKTSYKSPGVAQVPPGSVADHILKS